MSNIGIYNRVKSYFVQVIRSKVLQKNTNKMEN